MVQTTNPQGAAKAVVGMKGGVECSIHSGGTSFERVASIGAALFIPFFSNPAIAAQY